jgi:Chromo (CHRromatin Organisation MOdifier) domain
MKGKKSVKEELYSVEKVLGKKIMNGKVFYHIKWLNYSHAHNSWEPERNLEVCPELIEEYEAEHLSEGKLTTFSNKRALFQTLLYSTQITTMYRLRTRRSNVETPKWNKAIAVKSKEFR